MKHAKPGYKSKSEQKHPVVIVTRPDTHGGMSVAHWLQWFNVADEFVGAEVGEQITLEYREMTQKQYDALGESDGW